MKRLLILIVVFTVIVSSMIVPALADEGNLGGWTELLETETVNDSGNNLVKCTTSTTKFSIKTPVYMRITKVDILIAHDAYGAPTNLRLEYNGGYYTLTKAVIDANTTRYYGDNIPDTLYADLRFEIGRSGSDVKHYQVLSCRVSQFTGKTFQASSFARINGEEITAPFAYEYSDPDIDPNSFHYFSHFQFPLLVTDWQKYDSITVTGSVGTMALNSVRCTIGGSGVPFEMSYTSSNPTGEDEYSLSWNEIKYYSYDEMYAGKTETDTWNTTEYLGKTLFSITVDLRGLDRNIKDELFVYFTCLASDWYGYSIQIVNVTGNLEIADVTEVSWWQKITSFLTDLFDKDSAEADEFKDEAAQKGDEMADLNEQLQDVTKPPVTDIHVDIDAYIDPASSQGYAAALTALTRNSLMLSMMCITLTIAFVGYILYGKR